MDVFGEAGGRAIDTDFDLPAQSHTLGVLQLIENSPANIIDEAFKLDGMTLLTEVGAAFIVGVRGEEGAIGGEDAKREKAKEGDDLY